MPNPLYYSRICPISEKSSSRTRNQSCRIPYSGRICSHILINSRCQPDYTPCSNLNSIFHSCSSSDVYFCFHVTASSNKCMWRQQAMIIDNCIVSYYCIPRNKYVISDFYPAIYKTPQNNCSFSNQSWWRNFCIWMDPLPSRYPWLRIFSASFFLIAGSPTQTKKSISSFL